MLWASARGWHSWNFTFYEEDTPVAATTLFSGWEGGDVLIGESRYRIYREQVTSGAFLLEGEGLRLARAGALYALQDSFLVEHIGKRYGLRAESESSRGFILVD